MAPLGSGGSTGEIGRAQQRLGLSTRDLWVGYFAVGGNGSLDDVERWLGTGEVPRREHNLLAQALNDRFTAHGLDHPVGYRERRGERQGVE